MPGSLTTLMAITSMTGSGRDTSIGRIRQGSAVSYFQWHTANKFPVRFQKPEVPLGLAGLPDWIDRDSC